MHSACVLRLKMSHVRTSNAFWMGRPCISISKNILHVCVHVASSPVSSVHSFMFLRRVCRGVWLAWINPSDLCSSSQLQKERIPIHCPHPPMMSAL